MTASPKHNENAQNGIGFKIPEFLTQLPKNSVETEQNLTEQIKILYNSSSKRDSSTCQICWEETKTPFKMSLPNEEKSVPTCVTCITQNLKDSDLSNKLPAHQNFQVFLKEIPENDRKVFNWHRGYTELLEGRIKSQEKQQAKRDLEQSFIDWGWQRNVDYTKCPKCVTPVTKDSGCNFMKCESDECNSKEMRNHFCFLCEKSLQGNEHFSHFYNNPFGDLCKGK